MTSTAALIIASSYHPDENPENEEPHFPPMEAIEGTTAIKREIATLRQAGAAPILVLGGYQSKVLKNHLSHNNILFSTDDAYNHHTLEDTVRLGIDRLPPECSRVLILPAEYPVFSSTVVEKLLTCEKTTIPTNGVHPGFPRLLCLEKDWMNLLPNFLSEHPEENENLNFMQAEDPGICHSLLGENGMETIGRYVREQNKSKEIKIKLKVMLEKEERFFGPGVYELLVQVGRTGSIQAAVSEMGMSYSKGWKIINRLENEMGFAFLKRSNGGRNGGSSTLTEEGQIFLERYRAMTEDIERAAKSFMETYFRDYGPNR